MSLHDQILEADDIETEAVEMGEFTGWPGKVWIKGLEGTERDSYESSLRIFRGDEAIPDLVNMRAKLVVRTLVEEDGTRVFTDEEDGIVGRKSAKALDKLFDVAARLSALSKADVEELAKNSEAAPSGDSTSSLPSDSAAL